MTFVLAYVLAVGPVLALAAVAVWPPRPWQVALVLAAPLVSGLAALGVSPFDDLGWLSTIGAAYAVLLVAPALPWGRRWARFAVPGTVVAVCLALVLAAGGEVAVLFYLAPPVLVALGALVVAGFGSRSAHDRASEPVVGSPPKA